MEQWSNEAMEQWSNGAIEQWSNGAMEQLSNGAMEQWRDISGPLAPSPKNYESQRPVSAAISETRAGSAFGSRIS